jgi:HAMP domain-containing protein
MNSETRIGDQNSPRLSLEYLEKKITALTAIVSAALAVLVVAFGAGVLWAGLLSYEQRVIKLQDDLTKLADGMNQFKMNIGQLGDPSYETEVTNDRGGPGVPGGSRCERGNVVTGARYDGDGKRMRIQCASVSRAVWNPFAAEQARK